MDSENVRLSEEVNVLKQQQVAKAASANTTPMAADGATPAAISQGAKTGGS